MSAPGRRMDSTKHFGMDALRLGRVSIAPGDSHWPLRFGRGLFLCRALGSHPFVPAGLTPVAQDIIHRPPCLIRNTVQTQVSRDTFAGQRRPCGRANPLRFTFSFYAVCLSCVQCQCRSRFQQISASLRATATRAIFALERFRTRA